MSSTTSSVSGRSKKYVVPKVWKRPHSTIYGKNVEFGSALYSDKIGEINSRKFNSELPYSVRNSGLAYNTYHASSSTDGYLSNPMFTGTKSMQLITPVPIAAAEGSGRRAVDGDLVIRSSNSSCYNFKDMLEATNPSRFASESARNRNRRGKLATGGGGNDGGSSAGRVDFYATYLDDFNREVNRQNDTSLLCNDPLLTKRKAFDENLDFDYELGLFLPASDGSITNMTNKPSSSSSKPHFDSSPLVDHYSSISSSSNPRSSSSQLSYYNNAPAQDNDANFHHNHHHHHYHDDDNKSSSVPMTLLATSTIATPITKTNQTTLNTNLLPKHRCQISASPYGQSMDGRKLSLSTIDPMSYRPPVPSKSTSAHATGGEEYELHDRSSPFYTDRWAGKTIRHFDSDLYSNANLFKSMIL